MHGRWGVSPVVQSQETLFQQFLAGSDPSRRLAETQGTQGTQEQQSTRVEDLPWWKYQRALALWYCEWLDTYYDSGERRFLWRDELTQGFDAADLTEVKDLAMRMRLELPDHDAEIPDASSDVQAQKLKESSEGPGDAVEDDGNWHVAALAAAVEDDEELLWQEDGQGNLTHWAAEVGRLFLWQEHSGVLYEYVPASDTSFARWVARWALTPRLVVSASAELRVVDGGHGLLLGSEEPCWQFSSLQPQHARVFRKGQRWWVEALDDASPSLLNGQRLQLGEPMALLSSALLRLNDVELQLDLPETPGAAPATGVAATTATATAPVLQRDFVPREEESPSPHPTGVTGTAHAHALNRALRRLVCGSNTQSKALERPDVLAREQRYEDRAEKRRRLHPVEWPQPATPAATAPQPALAAPLEARIELQMSRRFTEQPG